MLFLKKVGASNCKVANFAYTIIFLEPEMQSMNVSSLKHLYENFLILNQINSHAV